MADKGKFLVRVGAAVFVLAVLAFLYWQYAFPIHRVETRSDLVMLGDLNVDENWSNDDLKLFELYQKDPFSAPIQIAYQMDLDQNGIIDEEDYYIIHSLVAANGNGYAAGDKEHSAGKSFPRPRELYRYVSRSEYRPRPYWGLNHSFADEIAWVSKVARPIRTNSYKNILEAAIYNEGVRLDRAWQYRRPSLTDIERDYAVKKLGRAKSLFESGQRYDSLLLLIELTEDAETLTVKNQPEIALKFLAFRDQLRNLLNSSLFSDFEAGKKDWRAILTEVSSYIYDDFGIRYDFETLEPARNLSDLGNYVQRVEWQYYKNTRKDSDFVSLVNYAQHDNRYLRAVSQTVQKHQDVTVQNHNLPMVLLFREALRISNGDKKKAIGLIDEAVRIPFFWLKSLPSWARVDSVAQGNFLLPGNKEDGSDKSRHWNVFGGLCIYKMPQQALDLALKREMQDLRKENFSSSSMREFFRDMIANLNGMYHVLSVNPDLLTTNLQP